MSKRTMENGYFRFLLRSFVRSFDNDKSFKIGYYIYRQEATQLKSRSDETRLLNRLSRYIQFRSISNTKNIHRKMKERQRKGKERRKGTNVSRVEREAIFSLHLFFSFLLLRFILRCTEFVILIISLVEILGIYKGDTEWKVNWSTSPF